VIPRHVQNVGVKIRSHIMRAMDPADPWNRAILAITFLAGLTGAALTLWLDRELFLAVAAAGSAFLSWALARELDPDRQSSAIVAAAFGAGWALFGQPTALLPFTAVLMTARLLVETTGRRPLTTDLGAMAILATVVSFDPMGWVTGFGLALAVYVDDRMAEEHNRQALLAALAGAAGSTAVVTLTGSLPETLPSIRPLLTASIGVLTLIAVAREPADPVSYVDSRSKKFLRRDRLHAGRAAVGLVVFIAALVSAEQAGAVIPIAAVLAIALVSSEIERLTRPMSP
jgi:hypothetical protein